jgi:hypothetical protein
MDEQQTEEVLDFASGDPGDETLAEESVEQEQVAAPETPEVDPNVMALQKQVETLQHMVIAQQQAAQQYNDQVEYEYEEVPEPDPQSTSPSDYVNFYVSRAVDAATAPLLEKLQELQNGITPIRRREAFTSAYHQVASQMGVNGKSLGPAVGSLLEDPNNADLVQLADSHPQIAARQLIRLAQASQASAKAAPARRQPNKRPKPRPSGYAGAGRAPSKIPMSFGEAFADTFLEKGVPADAAVTFTTEWASGPTGES